MIKIQRIVAMCILLTGSVSSAATLWEDDFNSDRSEEYEILLFLEGRDSIEFHYDYSELGIPEAPNSTSGGTLGVIMRANDPAEANQPNSVPCGRRPTTETKR